MPETVLEAIKLGLLDFEPKETESEEFEACGSMPGTAGKLTALAERVRRGLPLWHPDDRLDCDEERLVPALEGGGAARVGRRRRTGRFPGSIGDGRIGSATRVPPAASAATAAVTHFVNPHSRH